MNSTRSTVDITHNSFFAWSVYTAYKNPELLWPGSRWIKGSWLGIPFSDVAGMKKDIDFRILALRSALEKARQHHRPNNWVSYFVVPEFYFHSVYGPYPDWEVDGKDVFTYICNGVKRTIEELGLKGWAICMGGVLTCNLTDVQTFLNTDPRLKKRLARLNALYSKIPETEKLLKAENHSVRLGLSRSSALDVSYLEDEDKKPETGKVEKDNFDAQMNAYRADPLCVVRNRSAMFFTDNSGIRVSPFEKQAESTVDLTVGIMNKSGLETGNMITEWMAGYPSISIIQGDHLKNQARIEQAWNGWQGPSEIGTEICLDHRLKRLRRTAAMEYVPPAKDAKAIKNKPLDIQLIPSGGMQILHDSVTAGSNGAIFNADGTDLILTEYNDSGVPVFPDPNNKNEGITGQGKVIASGVYSISMQDRVDGEGGPYYSHSQLSFRAGNQEMTGFDNAKYNNRIDENMHGPTYDGSKDNPSNSILDKYNFQRSDGQIIVDPELEKTCFAAGLGVLHIYTRPN